MTPEARNWLMMGMLDGRSIVIAPERLATMPEEIFDYAPNGDVLRTATTYAQGFEWHVQPLSGFEQCALLVGTASAFTPKVSFIRQQKIGTNVTRFEVGVVVTPFFTESPTPAPTWNQTRRYTLYQRAVRDAQDKLRHVYTREIRVP